MIMELYVLAELEVKTKRAPEWSLS